jgi:hypothetical protein
MSINLLQALPPLKPREDRESSVAWFKTLVPWVAPEAYFHIVFKPAPPKLLAKVSAKLRFPKPVVDFLAVQNGAMLFSGSISVYGVVEEGTLLNRRDPFSLPPFNIEQETSGWSVDPERLLVLGGYQFDGSRVCIDRVDSHIYVYQPKARQPGASWPSLEQWLSEEIARLSALFDREGRLVGSEAATGPPVR